MSLSARTLRSWSIAIGGMGFLDALHVLVAAHITRANSHATTGWVAFCMAHPWVIALPVFGYGYAWIRFVRRSDQLAWGAAGFALLWLVVRIWTTAYATGHQDFIQGGAAMLGWLLGAAWARALGLRPSRSPEERLEADRFGGTGALAVFAATYVCAGTSKLLNTGFEWTGAVTIRLMAISHLRVDDTSLLAGLKTWLAHNSYAGTVLQWATVIVQLGAVTVLLGRRARVVWCFALALLHVGIYLSSGIVFLTPMVIALAFAVPWDRRRGAEPREAESREAEPPALDPVRVRRVLLAAGAGLVLVLSLVWLTPLGPALRFQVQPWQVAR